MSISHVYITLTKKPGTDSCYLLTTKWLNQVFCRGLKPPELVD